jgi:hypothetical protein
MGGLRVAAAWEKMRKRPSSSAIPSRRPSRPPIEPFRRMCFRTGVAEACPSTDVRATSLTSCDSRFASRSRIGRAAAVRGSEAIFARTCLSASLIVLRVRSFRNWTYSLA